MLVCLWSVTVKYFYSQLKSIRSLTVFNKGNQLAMVLHCTLHVLSSPCWGAPLPARGMEKTHTLLSYFPVPRTPNRMAPCEPSGRCWNSRSYVMRPQVPTSSREGTISVGSCPRCQCPRGTKRFRDMEEDGDYLWESFSGREYCIWWESTRLYRADKRSGTHLWK